MAPVFVSTTTRACGWCPSTCRYAVSRAVSSVAISSSNGMFFSASSMRRAAISIRPIAWVADRYLEVLGL